MIPTCGGRIVKALSAALNTRNSVHASTEAGSSVSWQDIRQNRVGIILEHEKNVAYNTRNVLKTVTYKIYNILFIEIYRMYNIY